MSNKSKKLESVETVAVVNNDLKALLHEDCVIVEGNTYNNYKEENEVVAQQGFDTLVNNLENFFEGEELQLAIVAILYGKFWNDRKTFNKVRGIVKVEAEKAGMDICDYEQNKVRPVIEKVTSITKSLSQINYALNYLKPRENYRPSVGREIQVKIGGKIYFIGSKLLETLKAQHQDDVDALRKAILEVASETSKSSIEEF